MKITSFKADKVYGYLNFDIDYHSDLSFLIGLNGSGKTTILKIIQALLTPSLPDLLSIPYTFATVKYEENNAKTEITSTKNQKNLTLIVSAIDEKLILPMIFADELEFIISRSNRPSRINEVFEEYQLKYSNTEIFKFISKINAPVFLGLERTHKTAPELPGDHYYKHEEIYEKKHSTIRAKRIVRGSLSAGLIETQILIQDAYRRLKKKEDKLSENLKESILLSAFNYLEFSMDFNADFLIPNWQEQQQILKRKDEIKLALKNIGVFGTKTTTILENFFNRLNNLFDSTKNMKTSKGFPIELLVNKAQINRVSELIGVIDHHKSEVDQLQKPITTFLNSLNSFYSDTQKTLVIDTVGQLGIERQDKSVIPINAFSSGERQLLIIFAHLLFNEYGTRSNVFIIDEPELSLHLKWQECFVEKAIEVSPSTQLILATHSPEIVAGYENKAINV